MTGTHEQVRLLKPAHGAAEMRAVDGEDLKFLALDTPHPARNICRRPVPWPRVRVAVGRKPRLTRWKAIERAERDPRVVRPAASEAGKNIADDGNTDKRRRHHVERCPKLQQKTTARSPGAGSRMICLLFNRHVCLSFCS